MAVNRVVLQHMSLNLLEEFPPYNNINGDIGILADQQVSISPTFYEQLFCTKVFFKGFMCLQFVFVT